MLHHDRRTPRGLNGGVVKLEAGRKQVHGSDLFVIWGKGAADVESKVKKAKASGDLNPGDRYSARIWSRSTEMPASRWTSLFAMFKSNKDDHELEAWLDCNGHKRTEGPCHPDPVACHYPSDELCEQLASVLPRLD
jgi:hypothetical protein